MTTSDILSNRPNESQVRRLPETRPSPRGLAWKLGMVALVVVVVAASAVSLMPVSEPSSDVGPVVTRNITRGDLIVSVTEQGTLESSNNTEIKCKVRGANTIIWVIENGTQVQAGDELVRLDTLLIEEQISERTKFAHLARASAERSKANVANARLAVSEYLEGRFVSALSTLEKDLAIAGSRLSTAKNELLHARMMSEREYVSEIEVEEKEFAVTQAELNVRLKKTEIEVLQEFTKEEELAGLRGNLAAESARYEADKERVFADEKRLKRAQDEFEQCVVRAERGGMVIFPTGEQWKEAPEIEEGATVHKDQVLLLMPDLTQMQVKVGIHESIIDQIRPGLAATVKLPDSELKAVVDSVAEVAAPAGWWTGNVVKYDTIIKLPQAERLKPGMSVQVQVILARHENVLMIPAAAVIETNQGYACWVKTAHETQRRSLVLGDSNDMFIVVKSGVEQGDSVVLNPLAHIEQAQIEAAQTLEETNPQEPERPEAS